MRSESKDLGMIRRRLMDVVMMIPEEPDDKKTMKMLEKKKRFFEKDLLCTARRLKIYLSPSSWATMVGICLFRWSEGGREFAATIEPGNSQDVSYKTAKNADLVDLLRHIVYRIYLIEKNNTSVGVIIEYMMRLGHLLVKEKRDDLAYDLITFTMMDTPEDDVGYRELISFGVDLARSGGKPPQIALMLMKSAIDMIKHSTPEPQDRLSIYDQCELVIEHIANLSSDFRALMGREFAETLSQFSWLNHLKVRLLPYIIEGDALKQYEKIIGAKHPKRIECLGAMASADLLPAYLNIMRAEIGFENERLRNQLLEEKRQVTTDSVEWGFTLGSYRRAIPHSGSLLKNPDFPKQLILLTHEISHVLCFIGGLGAALTALRIAALEICFELWRFETDDLDEAAEKFKKHKGIADLQLGDAFSLIAAERFVEVRKKSKILIEVWTPWLEGLAVFGELSADPTLDDLSINPVSECLRNLVDIMFDDKDPKSVEATFREKYREFEECCSAALRSIGAERILEYFRDERQPYFHGYMAVRAIVAAWRSRSAIGLTGPVCFNILLHATRFGIHEYIPDLSIYSDDFAEEAQKRMGLFVKMLTNIDKQSIDAFLQRESSDAPGRFVHWKEGHIRVVPPGEIDLFMKSQDEIALSQMEQALRSLTHQRDAARIEPRSDEERIILKMVSESSQEKGSTQWAPEKLGSQLHRYKTLFDVASFLSIGQCSSVFFLQRISDEDLSRIMINIRTREPVEPSVEAGYNGMWFPMARSDGTELEQAYVESRIPRLDVHRFVYLGYRLAPRDAKIAFPNFLFLKYGPWLHIHGTSTAAQFLKKADPEFWSRCKDIIGAKLGHDTLFDIEKKFIASGNEMPSRLLDWISQSSTWKMLGEPCTVDGWVEHVKKQIESLLSEEERAAARTSASRALMLAVYGDNDWSRKLAASSFPDLSASAPGQRKDMTSAIFDTGLRPGPSEFLDRGADLLSLDGVSLFVASDGIWDMLPAKAGD